MRRQLATALIAVAVLTGVPAYAADQQKKSPEELANEGLQSLLQAMEMLLKAIPQYEAPYVNEHGDIIIRRKNPPAKPDSPAEPDDKKHKKAI